MGNKYFGEEVDEAIWKFQRTNDIVEKQALIKNIIWPAFEKLASYHYHRLPVRKNEEIIYDCVVYLYEKIPMYDAEKKKQAFSYFNITARNFFYQQLKSEKKEVGTNQDTLDIFDSKLLENDALIDDELEKNIENEEFFRLFKEQLVKWKDRASKESEKIVIDALIVIFENADNIDIYKKKAIFWYIKEITGLNSKQVASNLAKIAKKFKNFKERFARGDI